ncbi:TonB-dependent receptor plug [Anaeromyxobacter dehalogenans 2CP-1]|uniref:TonB-dependent receptor plug n=1 Tax=Anaeromyxobacter dehalogenans (strain ATCC BAA-258 / DSM 21875 / 2CP-1) TaxID=455488 RepID=B8JA17_ANAD2|nr:TonB-dependent receptor [Anaeromyxobacter dehalogenans]ACL63720.1 TonB-dependent receptor plug [Anaeromyxobacter dehalogenans 2CP-1]
MSASARLAARTAIALACATCPALAAGAAPGPDPDDPVVVLEEQVVRLPRATTEARPLASGTVVDRATFEGEAKDVGQLVSTAPGIAVEEHGGLGQLTTISIRGSPPSGVKVLLDGLPLNTAFGGGVDLSTIPRSWVDAVEVVRGPEGARYGSGALGGVLNVVTRRPEAGSWSLETGGGSFDTARVAADVGTSVGPGAVLLGATAETTSGRFPFRLDPGLPGGPTVRATRENAGVRRGGLLAKLIRPQEHGRLDALLEVSGGHRGLPGFAAAPTPWAWQDDARLLAMGRVARFGALGPATLAARGHLRLDRLDARLTGPDDSPIRQRGAAAGLALEATGSHRHGVLSASLETTAELLAADGLGGRRDLYGVAAAVADDLSLAGGGLRIAPAARAERAGQFGGVSGSLGLSVRLAPALRARAGVGRTFRPPGLAELHLQQGLLVPNPDLRPETAVAADAGWVADGRAGLLAVTGHLTRYEDLVVYEPSDAFGRLKPFNSGRASATGLEVEGASAPVGGPLRASARGSYTLLVTELLRGAPAEVGHWIPYRPRQRAFLRVALAPGPLSAHVELHRLGRRYRDRRGVNPIPSSTSWNAGLGVRVARRPGVRIHLEVLNLADDRTLTDGVGDPLPPRTVMVTLRAGSSAQEYAP